jgi:predicted  nucleic acid-binding Zn ribbon protein
VIASITRRLFGIDVYQELKRLDRRQQDVIHAQQAWLAQTQLESLRCQRDLVLGWRISVERPEVDIREDLEAMYRDLSDQIARIEEHVLS